MSSDGRAGCILVIEDDAAVRLLLTETLEDEGYAVMSAPDAEGAWPLLHRQTPDLVLLDLILPGMDGNEACRRLRAEPLLSDVPVLMLTARNSLDDRIDGLTAGADDYIVKPFHPRELIARVATHLRRSERERNLNPLTHLPGNRAIERAIEIQVARRVNFAVCYIDIDQFKAYNDRYGFAAGDGVIRLLADLVRRAVLDDDPIAVVGHIGGDDFLALIDGERAGPFCEQVIADFGLALPTLYSADDLAKGYVVARNRRGDEEQLPLMSLSIAVVPVSPQDPPEQATIAALAQSAAEIKYFLKSKPGSGYLIDRRRSQPGS
jgi:PleD family two-component response regulator